MDIEELTKDIPEKEDYIFYLENMKKSLESVLDKQLIIGFCLNWFNIGEKYRTLGYDNLSDFSMGLFRIKRSSAYNYMNVYKECAEGRIEGDVIRVSLLEEYEEYTSIYQLVELIKIPKERRGNIDSSMSVREIRNKRIDIDNEKAKMDTFLANNFNDYQEENQNDKIIKILSNIDDLYDEKTKREILNFFDGKINYIIKLVFKQE